MSCQPHSIGTTTRPGQTQSRTLTRCGRGAGRYSLARTPHHSLPPIVPAKSISNSFGRSQHLAGERRGPGSHKISWPNTEFISFALSTCRGTHLDGAVLQLADGTPVIGMTLRYDRLDNFWFCLLHELAHIGRHMDGKREVAFIDDLSLRDVEGVRRDPKDVEADEWALEALIPDAAWQTSHIQDHPSPLAVIELAQQLGIHPAIVAGPVRHETGNFRLLSHFVGTGEVRRQLAVKDLKRANSRAARTSSTTKTH